MKNNYVVNTLKGNFIYERDIDSLFEDTTSPIFWKDKNGFYLGANSKMANFALLDNVSDFIGTNDFDLLWKSEAPELRQNDLEVIKTDSARTLIEHSTCLEDKKIRLFLAHKLPLKNNEGKTIGMFGISFLIEADFVYSDFFKKININFSQSDESPQLLTPRQFDCLFLLVKGMTIKQIAHQLNLSARTVEHYLENVKDKMMCKNRSELISKGLQLPQIKKMLLR